MKNDISNVFLVINLSYFGDVLLTNGLCRNIKQLYPDSKVVFLVNKPFYEAAKYQEYVDDVIVFDKRNTHKGLMGLLKFVFNCEYRNKINTAFVIYANARGILISFLLGAHKRVSGPARFLKYLLTDIHYDSPDLKNMQDINSDFIRALTGEKTPIFPIKYVADKNSEFANKIRNCYIDKEIIGLCCVSKLKEKDMPIETAIKIINLANKDDKIVLFFGTGSECKKYAENIKQKGCTNFVDLTDTTTIKQLADVLALCNVLISIDTGTMHLACAVGIPVLSVFYMPEMIDKWAPRNTLYKSEVISENYSPENIYNKAINLYKKITG